MILTGFVPLKLEHRYGGGEILHEASVMENEQGTLSPEQQSRIHKWITDKLFGKIPSCPLCYTSNWNIPEHLVQLRPFQGGSIVIGGTVYPCLSVICLNCGYTMLVNAVIAGIVLPEPEGESNAR